VDRVSDSPRADVAVIGGSGFYAFLPDPTEHVVPTPYGDPSAPIGIAEVAGRRVAFLPRHGAHHEHPPHGIPYRANAWALRSLGVRQVLAPCAVGGLRDTVAPGDLVVPDQLVDRTHRRTGSFVESGAVHLPFADPYCPGVSRALAAADPDVRAGATMVVVEGPRFSTRAESRHYADQGWDADQHDRRTPRRRSPARWASATPPIALVTDMDAGAESRATASARSRSSRSSGRTSSASPGCSPQPSRPSPTLTAAPARTWWDGVDLTYEVPGIEERR
jgi:5'-methylthioadenosine phosphorylase